MKPVGFSACGSSSISAGLGTWSNNKKKAYIKSIYSYGPLYKKSKNPRNTDGMVDLSTGSISGDVLQASILEHKEFWGSKVESEEASVSGISNLKNMDNMITKKISYVDSNDSEANNIMKSSLPVANEINDRFATLEHSLASLTEQVGKLAKRLDALESMVSQPSLGCQPLVTLSLQNQGVDAVISKSSDASTSSETVVGVVLFDVSSVSKLKYSMRCLIETVLGLSTKVDILGTSLVPQYTS
ncbi:hypothetical protein G9A89_010309 [Geosiphon pyriformis]|nr:hypothetical protein G9A89_010309 [Geosiphon pyriformis]